MATLKQYQTLVKKVNESTGDARSDAAKQKAAVADALRRSAKSKADLRKLKFTMDEINNS